MPWLVLALALQDDPAELVRKLADESYHVREAAENDLIRMGGRAEEAVRAALEKTTDEEVRVRARRILRILPFRDALGIDLGRKFGSAGGSWARFHVLAEEPERKVEAPAGEVLAAALLEDLRDAQDKRDFAYAVGEKKVISCGWALVRLLRDPDAAVRWSALLALWTIDAREHAGPAAALLNDPDPHVRRVAAGAVGRLGGADLEKRLAEKLDDEVADVREAALAALGERGARARIDEIAARLKDPEAKVAERALSALARLKAVEALDRIAAVLEHRDPWLRRRALETFLALDARGRKDAVLARLKDEDEGVRESAARTLIAWGGAAELLEHPDPTVRRLAIDASGGDRKSELLAQLADEDPSVRSAAARRIGEIGGADEAPALEKLLGDPEADVRAAAAAALAKSGPDGSRVAALLGHDDAGVRRIALGFARGEHAAEVAKRLEDPDPEVRRQAVDVLVRLNAKAHAAAVARRLEDPDVCYVAAVALKKLWTKEDADAAVALLSEKTAFARLTGVQILARLGTRGESVAPLLVDRDEEVRAAAVEALARIQGKTAIDALEKLLRTESSETVREALHAALDRLRE